LHHFDAVIAFIEAQAAEICLENVWGRVRPQNGPMIR